MAKNPYLSADESDDDVFESDDGSSKDHTFGNRPCRKRGCGLTHDVRLRDGEQLPPEVAAELSKLLDTVPREIVEKAVIIESPGSEALSLKDVFLRFAHTVRRLNPTGPITLAVAQVLDDQTNGAVTRRFHVYKAEWYVVNVAMIRGILANFITYMKHENNDKHDTPEVIFAQLEETRVYIEERYSYYVQEYRNTCELYDHPVDDVLVDTGKPDESRVLAREIMYTTLEDSLSVFFEGRGIRDNMQED